MRDNSSKKGFTLLELIVVIIIVGVLASLALTRFFKLIEYSRSVEAISTLRSIRAAVERCYIMRGGDNFCLCVPQGLPHALPSEWQRLGIDDPRSSPNAHFDYSSTGCNINVGYSLRASRNALDSGSNDWGNDYIGLDFNNTSNIIQIKGYGAYNGLIVQ